MRKRQSVAPTSLAVSLADARTHCAISDSTHDVLLRSLISAATSYAEKETGCIINPQVLILTFESFPDRIPLYPIRSIESIKYDDADGVEQTLDPALYTAQLDGMNPVISAESWPSTKGEWPVRIEVNAGFLSVPDDLKHAILVMVQEMYAQRGESITGLSVSPSMFTASRLLSGFRRWNL